MHKRILIVYGTSYGQTAKIAKRMRDILAASGFDVVVTNADAAAPDLDPAAFDGVLVGGSLIKGVHQPSVQRFVTRHCARLNDLPSAFFSVSASAASEDEAGQEDARRAMERFLTETGWNPRMRTTVAGAIAYTKYSFIVRWMLRRISRENGGPTDTSRDHELTDWGEVESFTRAFARSIDRAPVAPQFALSIPTWERQ